MKIIFRLLAILALIIVGLLLLQQIAAESGEVVTLTTEDDVGALETTRLWIVELEGRQYLRAGMPQAGWYQRLLGNPNVRMQRGDVQQAYMAVPDLARTPEIDGLMREKYGWADAYIGFLFGREESVPVRLD
jgi:hypothetical protein